MCRLTAEELRHGGEDTLFVLAGAGGDIDELRPLGEALTHERRVVALALSAEPGGDDTIETMAAESVDAIRAEQPHGPYQLLGYSLGGIVALVTAQLLADAGETVAFVGLVDSFFDRRHWPTRLFARATTRRAVLHARGLLGRPPTEAARELSTRSAQLVRRVHDRHRAVDTGAPTRQTREEANLTALARWQPQVVDRPVTFFAATESDFGCELADLWAPWLPQLELVRVWGNHLDLVGTAPGVARLARAVERELRASTPRLKVLVATTFRWSGAARLAVDLHQIGCTVQAVAPRGSALHVVSAVQRSHRLRLVDPIRCLRDAIEASNPDLVLPFDDRSRHALALLYAGCDAGVGSGSRVRALLERSLGSPRGFELASSRAEVLAIARDSGVLGPPTAVVRSAGDIFAWLSEHPGPAVLKTDGSWGGRGVAILRTEADARKAWRELGRRPSLVRALKRLVVEGDPWALRVRVAGTAPAVSIQPYVAGRAANAAVACFQGATLAAVQAEVVESEGPTGPSTVVRVIDHPDMAYAVKTLVSSLELSGLCGLDFIVDEHGRAHLIELNPRATPTSHLLAADGTDPLTALRTALGHEHPPARRASVAQSLVALFPQELMRDAASPHLGTAHHDVPTHAPDLISFVLAGSRARRRSALAAASDRGPGTGLA